MGDMRFRVMVAAVCGAAAAARAADIVSSVRAALAHRDTGAAEAQLQAYRADRGVTPEWLEAYSWVGRSALAEKSFDSAGNNAVETRRLAIEMLKHRALDAEKHLPTALGAAIEVHAQVLAARGERGEAVAFLREELARYRATSIRIRVQKNLHLLSLEGQPAPALDVARWVGAQPSALAALRGKRVLLFFWAHWCGPCKGEVPALVALREKYRDLALVAPTQCYGYVAGGREATEEQETARIKEVWDQAYKALGQVPAPLSQENFRVYGASTTPTFVLLDRQGNVRLYYPGTMTYAELAARLDALP